MLLHFCYILTLHSDTCAALLMVENNKVIINIQYKLVYITNLSFFPVCMSGSVFHLIPELNMATVH